MATLAGRCWTWLTIVRSRGASICRAGLKSGMFVGYARKYPTPWSFFFFLCVCVCVCLASAKTNAVQPGLVGSEGFRPSHGLGVTGSRRTSSPPSPMTGGRRRWAEGPRGAQRGPPKVQPVSRCFAPNRLLSRGSNVCKSWVALKTCQAKQP